MDKRARSLRADAQAGTAKQRSKRKLRLCKEEDRRTKKQKASRATTLPFPVTAAEEQARQAESTTAAAAAKPTTTTAAKPATGSGPATAKRPTAAAIERSAVTKPIWEWQRSKGREERSIPGKERAAKKSTTTAWREPFSLTGR